MSASKHRKQIESMLLWHCQNNPTRAPVRTNLTRLELKAAGAQEFDGRLTFQVIHGATCKTFELLERK